MEEDVSIPMVSYVRFELMKSIHDEKVVVRLNVFIVVHVEYVYSLSLSVRFQLPGCHLLLIFIGSEVI
jgi:hypothetical protein